MNLVRIDVTVKLIGQSFKTTALRLHYVQSRQQIYPRNVNTELQMT